MKKGELAAAVAEQTGLNRSAAVQAVDAVFGTIAEAMKRGEEVRIPGFGNFVVSNRAASTGRNPKTGEPIEISASKQPRFKAGKVLRESLNG